MSPHSANPGIGQQNGSQQSLCQIVFKEPLSLIQGSHTSQQRAFTPMKFVKFQDEISETSGGGGGENPLFQSKSEGGEELPPCGTPVFLCSVDVEPSHSVLLEQPVYENQIQFVEGVRIPSQVHGGGKIHPESSALSNAERESLNRSVDFERRLSPDPHRFSTIGRNFSNGSRKISNDPVLNSITSDLDYILNHTTSDFGSLKRGVGHKGILKKISSYGKSYEDLRPDARTNL